MDTQEISSIKQKSTASVLFLTLRNVGIQAVSVIGFFILTLLLDPSDVGLFAIVAESISVLGYFSDLGLAAALVQQSDEVTSEELRTSFTVQQILVVVSLLITTIIYRHFHFQKSYGQVELCIFMSLCFSYLTASLKTIPSVILERKLNFRLISTIDIVENLSFYVIAVMFAFAGFGAYSYAIATFVRSLLGLVLIYRLQAWSIGFAFSVPTIKSLFKFGLPYQLNSLIAMTKDRLSNLLVAGIIGREAFGLISWAQKGPRLPLSLMDAVMRVTFPTFSRLQHEPALLTAAIKKSIYYISLLVLPFIAGIALTANDIVNLIPKYSKWSAAILPLYFYSFSFAIAAITTPLTNAFNAVGKITTTTKFMLMWTILTWVCFPLLSLKYNYLGTAIAAVIVGLSSLVVWYFADQTFHLNLSSLIAHPIVSTVIMITVITLLRPPFILKIVFGLLIYFVYHYLFSRQQLSWLVTQIKCHFAKK